MKTFNFYISFLLLLIMENKSFAQNNPYSSENTLSTMSNNVNSNPVQREQNLNMPSTINIGYEMNKAAMGGQPNLSKSSINNSLITATATDNLTLPLLNFVATLQNNETVIQWNVSHAAPDADFEIERKDANGIWQKIGNISSYTTTTAGLQYEFTDATPLNGINNYRLKQRYNGDILYSGIIHAELNRGNEGLLFQNYPNPFRELTNIQYHMRNSGPVKVVVYDLSGRQIAVLVNQNQVQGTYQAEWNGRDYPAGTYIYKIVTDEDNITQKMVKSR